MYIAQAMFYKEKYFRRQIHLTFDIDSSVKIYVITTSP